VFKGYCQVKASILIESAHASNRAEQTHEATRIRERVMRKFNPPGQAQRFLGVHAAVYNLFNLGWHLVNAEHYRKQRESAFSEWSNPNTFEEEFRGLVREILHLKNYGEASD
jgi:hypothetical protein